MNAHTSVNRLALLGMDHRSAKIVKKLLQQMSPQVCDVVDISDAEYALLDLDGANQQGDLELLQHSYSHIPTIVISIKAQVVEGMHFLRKPLSLQKLAEQIRQIESPATVKKAVDNVDQHTAEVADGLMGRVKKNQKASNSYSVSDNVFFDPSSFTLSYVQEAILKSRKAKKSMIVKLWNQKTILVDAEHGKILSDFSNEKMRALGIVEVDQCNTKIHIKTADSAFVYDFNPRFNSSVRIANIDEFIWRLAFTTSRGRLPKYLGKNTVFNLQTPVHIDQWPNFTRMAPIPEAIPAVAFWIQAAIPIGQLSIRLGVAEEHINNLFFACFSVGIAGQDRSRSSSRVRASNTKEHKNRSIFAAILGHLTGKS